MASTVRTGLDVLRDEGFSRLAGKRVGLIAHQASVDAKLDHVLDLMCAAGVRLESLLGPEHGVAGAAQDMEAVASEGSDARDPATGARVYSLYGASEASLHPTPEMLEGLDVLVIDLQDVGARYYTFAATMGYAMQAASRVGLRVLVLDRPNPLGGRPEDVEGPRIEDSHRSFVGAFDMPIRHGLTLGEYARYVRARCRIDVDLEVVPLEGWRREMAFEATGLPWVLPSPNMPTVDTAWVYPGQCLLEGTNLSEGRGTTRPFELCGAPYLDGRAWATRAGREVGLGFVLRPTVIRPTFQKHAGQSCGAVQVHVTDRRVARPVRMSIALIRSALALAPDAFRWRTEKYEFVSDRLAIDLLLGSDRPRKLIETGVCVEDIVGTFRPDEAEFREARRSALLYPEENFL